jgi:hypothetical protein
MGRPRPWLCRRVNASATREACRKSDIASFIGHLRRHLFGFQKAISNIYFTMRLKHAARLIGKRRARCSRDPEARTMQATEAYTESEQRLELRLELRNDLELNDDDDDNHTKKFVIQID